MSLSPTPANGNVSLVFRRLPPGLPRQCYADWQAVAGGRAGVESVIVPQWSELEAGVLIVMEEGIMQL